MSRAIDYESILAAADYPEGMPVKTPKPVPPVRKPLGPLEMPENCMHGWLGEHARTLDAPLGWGYASLMVAYASQGINIDELYPKIRPTLYVLLLGKAEDGKSTSAVRAMRSLDEHKVIKNNPASDRGLQKLFQPPPPPSLPGGKKGKPPAPVTGADRVLKSCAIFSDEFKIPLGKMQIINSALAPTFCSLFYEDDPGGSADKTGVHDLYIRLSLLGCLPCRDRDQFRALFGAEMLDGLYSRFLLIVGPSDWEFGEEWEPEIEMRKPWPCKIPSHVFTTINVWRQLKEGRRRLGELAMRVALITASANRENEISPAAVQAALRFIEWQEKVRIVYSASEATTPDAAVTGAILDAFGEAQYRNEDGRPHAQNFREISRIKNWARKYGKAVTAAKNGLIADGLLIEESFEEVKDKWVKTGKLILWEPLP